MAEEDTSPKKEWTDQQWNEAREKEYKRYYEYRPDLIEQQLEAEKNYDGLLVTLSSGAIGGSIVLLKDLIGTDRAVAVWAISIALLLFVASLGVALYHRKLTFDTHKGCLNILDEEFNTEGWQPEAWERFDKRYDELRGINLVGKLKDWAFLVLVVGVAFLALFLVINLSHSAPKPIAPAQQIIVPNVTVNIGPTTQPTK